jgi:hypothetical protein
MAKPIALKKVDDGSGALKHPLLAVRETYTAQQIADALGHKNHTTISIYCAKAKKSKNLLVPAEWVLRLAKLSGYTPAQFRPDLYRPEWRV